MKPEQEKWTNASAEQYFTVAPPGLQLVGKVEHESPDQPSWSG